MSDNDMALIGGALPRKMYYSISEVAYMTGLDQSVLRHWEKEFSKLRPKKNSAGKRAYRDKDIEVVLRIKQLLQDEKYTIGGAKKKFADERRAARAGGGNNADVDIDINVNADISADVNADTDAADSSQNKSAVAASIQPGALSDIRKGLQDILAFLES